MDQPHLTDLKTTIRTIPDYPKPGIMFRDITTLLGDARALPARDRRVGSTLCRRSAHKVAGIEARGFILGGVVAHQLSAGFVPIRKKGKLPHTTVSLAYSLEYGLDEIEMHTDAIGQGERVLLVDDLIATGGTAVAAVQLLRQVGADVIGACFVIDLPELGGSTEAAGIGRGCSYAGQLRGTLSSMRVGGHHYRTIWAEDGAVVVIDQTRLPFELVPKHLHKMTDAADAISTMVVRGAPLIGATAAYGVALAMAADPSDREPRRSHPDARCDTADRRQSALGARSHGEPPARPSAWRAGRLCIRGGRADRRGGCRMLPGHRRAWGRHHRRDRGAEGGAGQHPHALQCRLARDHRLGHGARPDLCRA